MPKGSSNPGWSFSFRDKTFQAALGLSILWHLFWFFSVNIKVSPDRQLLKSRPQIVSLGQVLDDSMLRTLVESRPEISETLYRRLSDFSSPTEIAPKTVERYSPGDVVSVSDGKKLLSFMRGVMGGEKTTPEYEFNSRIKLNYQDDEETEEEKKKRLLEKSKDSLIPEALKAEN